MKHYFNITKNGWCENKYCNDFISTKERHIISQVRIGSASCCIDCKYILSFNSNEQWINCIKRNNEYRLNKLLRLTDEE